MGMALAPATLRAGAERPSRHRVKADDVKDINMILGDRNAWAEPALTWPTLSCAVHPVA